jgi:hypothetical protein
VPLICPSRQVAKANEVQHGAIETRSLGPRMAQSEAQPRCRYAGDLPDMPNGAFYCGAGFTGWTGFGMGGSGSTCSFDSVGMTLAPAARAASPVER